MITIAITGGIGTGKTYVSSFFQREGIPVFYADTEAKKLYDRPEVLAQLRQTFGDTIFDGPQLSFAKLTQVIFNDKAALEKVNSIIHPLVSQEFTKWAKAQQSPLVLMESAIIFEGRLEKQFDYVITVDASLDTRQRRLRIRDAHLDEATIRRKIEAQLPQDEKCRLADFVIRHDHDDEEDYLQQQVKTIIEQIKHKEMQHSAIEVLLNHRSIRQFTNQPIEPDKLNLILRAACNGSTMGNMQLYSIIAIQDKQRMVEMAPLHFNQPIATNAPLMLIFCADTHRFNKYCQYRQADTDAYSNLQSYQWAVTDSIIAAQNACVAAESLGLGICWLGTITYNCDRFAEILHLPENVFPTACISIGYPAETPELTDKLPVEAMIHHEVYEDYTEERINNLYREKEAHPNTLKLLEENQLDNLAQIFTQRRYTKADNEHFAQVLAETLKRQKFM